MPDARRALEGEVAAHQPREAPADCEAEARASVLARGGAVGLREGPEQLALLFLRDADARVADGDAQITAWSGRPSRVGRRLDPAARPRLLRELEGIADQVGEDLPEPQRIADQPIGHDRARRA